MITLSLFVENKMNELGHSRCQVVEKLAYANFYKGYDLLDKIAKGEMIAREQVERLAVALDTDVKDFREPLLETLRLCEERKKAEEEKRKEKERAEFKPFLVAIGEKDRPEPVFVACLMHNRRFIRLDSAFKDLPEGVQLERISNLIGEHMETNKGGLPGFGYFTHYVYRRTYDEEFNDMLLFTTDGELIINPQMDMRRYRSARAAIGLARNKKPLEWLFGSS